MPREAKSITDIRAEARKHTATALRTLVGIASQAKAPPAARVAAATAILDRGWGKPKQPLSGDEDDPLRIKVIECVIVDPEDRDTPRLPAPAGPEPV